jgi:Tol biopolymer transport system component
LVNPTRTTILIAASLLVGGLTLPVPPLGAATPAPDEAVAFWSLRSGERELYLTRADGSGFLGNLTADSIAQDADPAWSPDGTRIAFAKKLVNKTTYELFVMSSEGGNLQRLTTNSVDDRQPAWSPDGSRIAFARGFGVDGYAQIFVINADGSGEVALTAAKAGKLDAEPAWSPDGTQIAFSTDRDGTLTEIYTMLSDGSAQTKRTFNACIDSNPAWSPDGSKVAFDRLCPGESSDLWTMNPAGGAQANVTNSPTQDEFDPDWSPDGTGLAFAGSAIGGGNRDIFTMSGGGGPPTRLTDHAGSDFGPDWHRFPSPRCTIVGTTGDDVLTGTADPDVICGLGGHDELSGLGGNDTLRGGDGKDFLKGGNGDDVFDGGIGADWADYSGVSGPTGVIVDLSSGVGTGQGADTLISVAAAIGSDNADTITGSAEDNTIEGGPGDDILNGGGGNDTADYSNAIKGVTVNLTESAPQATGQGVDALAAFEHLIGSDHGDVLTGDGGANRLDGGAGNDTLSGSAGDDALVGGPGDDLTDGGEGNDRGDYAEATGGVTVNLSVAGAQVTGGAGTDGLAGIENLTGSGFPDRLTGNGAANTLTGSGGDDTLEGSGGMDLLQGGDGNDRAVGGDGDDRVLGEAGNDVLSGSDGNDEVRGGTGQDDLSGDQGNDQLFGESEADVASGGPGDDRVLGNDGPDILSGGEGNDDVRGGASGDRLAGEAGEDSLLGEAGRDTITGGESSDLLLGGDGNDRILARDGLRDRVNGGPGRDRGTIDRGQDRVSGLESVRKRRPKGYRARKRRIAPGVTLTRIVAPGPRRLFVLAVRPQAAPTIEVALAQNALQGFERTSQMARRHRALAAINGDFGLPAGRPAHHLAQDGDLKQSSRAFGYNFAISHDELGVFIDRPSVTLSSFETDTQEIWSVDRWNDGLPALGEIAAHSPAGGILEPPAANACSARVVPSGPLRWGDSQVGLRTDHVVQEVSCAKAALPLNGGIVLSARPLSDEARLLRSLTPGETVTLSWSFGWPRVLDSVGGFPLLMRDGTIVAKKCVAAICGRHPRTGIGTTADGRLLLVTVDGRRRRHSVGMTLIEFAREFERLGATWALNLDGGGSSTMVVRGKVVNRPSDRSGERFVSSAILVLRGPDVDEPAPLAAKAGGSVGRKRTWTGDGSLQDGIAAGLSAARDPASTGGFLDALATGDLSPSGLKLPRDLLQLLQLFRSGR